VRLALKAVMQNDGDFVDLRVILLLHDSSAIFCSLATLDMIIMPQ
jgi:hypothetical protein